MNKLYAPIARKGDANFKHLLHIEIGEEKHYSHSDVSLVNEMANKNNIESQLELGRMLLFGNCVNTDYKQAYFWFNEASERGSGQASCFIANMFYLGLGIKKDESAAVWWFTKSVTQGFFVDMDSMTFE